MNVFAEKFLEVQTPAPAVPVEAWSWVPRNPKVADIYATGGKTATRQSTYADDRDNNADTDRPNEGP